MSTGSGPCRVVCIALAGNLRIAIGKFVAARIACEFRADGARWSTQLFANRALGKSVSMQCLSLAFALAQARVAHGQLHLPMKLRRLPRLGVFAT